MMGQQLGGPQLAQDCLDVYTPALYLNSHLTSGPSEDGLEGGPLDVFLPLPNMATLSTVPFLAFLLLIWLF